MPVLPRSLSSLLHTRKQQLSAASADKASRPASSFFDPARGPCSPRFSIRLGAPCVCQLPELQRQRVCPSSAIVNRAPLPACACSADCSAARISSSVSTQSDQQSARDRNSTTDVGDFGTEIFSALQTRQVGSLDFALPLRYRALAACRGMTTQGVSLWHRAFMDMFPKRPIIQTRPDHFPTDTGAYRFVPSAPQARCANQSRYLTARVRARYFRQQAFPAHGGRENWTP